MRRIIGILMILISPLLVLSQGREQGLKEAKKHMDAEEFELARQQYKLLTDLDDRDGEAWLGKGMALYHLNEPELAMGCFEKSQWLNVEKPELGYYQGLVHRRYKYYHEAIESFSRSLESDTVIGETYFFIGEAMFKLGNIEGSRDYLRKELKRNPNHHYAAYYLSKGYFQEEEIDSSRLYIKNALQINSDVPRFWLLDGDLHFAGKDYALAVSSYTSALNLNPEYEDARLSRAVSYMKMKIFSLAISDFEMAIEKDPTSQRLKLDLANCHYKNGDDDSSLKVLEELIDQSVGGVPSGKEIKDLVGYSAVNEEALMLWADIQLKSKGEYEKALSIYQGFTAKYPKNDKFWFLKGNAESALGRLNAAYESFDQCVDSNPKNIGGWYNKAVILFELEKKDHACHIWNEIVNKSDDEFYTEQALLDIEAFCK